MYFIILNALVITVLSLFILATILNECAKKRIQDITLLKKINSIHCAIAKMGVIFMPIMTFMMFAPIYLLITMDILETANYIALILPAMFIFGMICMFVMSIDEILKN